MDYGAHLPMMALDGRPWTLGRLLEYARIAEGEVFCLADAPNKEAAEAVHREAHGLLADEITEVEEGTV